MSVASIAERPEVRVGIVGGMGPQATEDFQKRLRYEARRQGIAPRYNSGYLETVTFDMRQPPIRFHGDRPISPAQMNPELARIFMDVAQHSDVVVCPTNTVDLFYPYLMEATRGKYLSTVAVTLEEVERLKLQRVGLMAIGPTLRSGLYQDKLAAMGVTTVEPRKAHMARLDLDIKRLMEEDDDNSGGAYRILEDLQVKQNAGHVILGCSEIPLLLQVAPEDQLRDQLDVRHLINPARLLAQATVDYALGKRKLPTL